jgi:hypothetical protein
VQETEGGREGRLIEVTEGRRRYRGPLMGLRAVEETEGPREDRGPQRR